MLRSSFDVQGVFLDVWDDWGEFRKHVGPPFLIPKKVPSKRSLVENSDLNSTVNSLAVSSTLSPSSPCVIEHIYNINYAPDIITSSPFYLGKSVFDLTSLDASS